MESKVFFLSNPRLLSGLVCSLAISDYGFCFCCLKVADKRDELDLETESSKMTFWQINLNLVSNLSLSTYDYGTH